MALSAALRARIDDFPADERPENIELLYYAYLPQMVGLGTLLLALAFFAAARVASAHDRKRVPLWILLPHRAAARHRAHRRLDHRRGSGRQPWLIYGLLRTSEGIVSQGHRRRHDLHAARILRLPCRAHLSLSLRARGRTRSDATRVDAGGVWRGMVMLWYAIVSVMPQIYAVLDGFDPGAGALHRVLAKTEAERQTSPPRPGRCGTATRSGSSPVVARRSCEQTPTQRASGFHLPLMLSVLWLLIAAVSRWSYATTTQTRCGVNSGHDPVVSVCVP